MGYISAVIVLLIQIIIAYYGLLFGLVFDNPHPLFFVYIISPIFSIVWIIRMRKNKNYSIWMYLSLASIILFVFTFLL